jgi:cardiolipin synthase A/B
MDAIRAATRRIAITSAYFLPDRAIRRALAGAVARGVDVRVITAGISDVPPIQLASRALYPRLLRAGVRLYERIERVLHAKTAVIDGRWSAIGSYNLNRRSIFHDLEVLAVFLDDTVGTVLDEAFDRDLSSSVEVDRVSLRARPVTERAMGQLLLRFASFL